MNENDYRNDFGLNDPIANKKKIEKALDHALDIRKFEIGLYWQRTAYFWALIAAAFAGYFAILSADELLDKNYLAYIVSCIGLVFTWAWFLVNRGSKFWQENWENHVDMLEDAVTGPLYKTVLSRAPDTNQIEKYITGALAVSVSKINQWVSLFTFCLWLVLLIHTAPEFNASYPLSIRHIVVISITVLFGISMTWKGRTFKGSYEHIANKRETSIVQQGDKK